MTRLNFLTPEEIKISSEFKKNGFIIRDGANKKSLNWIQSKFINLIKKLNENENIFFYIFCGSNEKEISKTIINAIEKKNCVSLRELRGEEEDAGGDRELEADGP